MPSEKIALVYAGPGVSNAPNDTVDALSTIATRAGFAVRKFVQLHPGHRDPTLVEALPGERHGNELSASDFAGASLWLAPGSDEGHTWFGSVGRLGIKPARNNYAARNVLRAGGYDKLLIDAVCGGLGYVGVCAGAYLGANGDSLDLLDEGSSWATGGGVDEVSVVSVATGVPSAPSAPVHYKWPLLAGPYFENAQSHGATVAARFTAPLALNGEAAAVTFMLEKGRVFLVGPHPEAPNDSGWDPGGESAWREAASLAANHAFLAAWMTATAR